jgi:hypothetical protein
MISGLFFVPVLCSAQTGGGIDNDNNSLLIPPINDNKSQAEVEAVEGMLYMEAMSDLQLFSLSDPQQTSSRIFTLVSNVINDDRSQAEAEAAEESQYIQAIPAIRQLNISDPIQVSSRQFTLISNVMATNYETQMSVIQSIR